jgi:hypothetical protein
MKDIQDTQRENNIWHTRRASTITMIYMKNAIYAALGVLSYATLTAADCTREGLLAAANSYISAQTAGSLTALSLSTKNFTYRENNKVVDIKKGVISSGLKLSLNRSTADTTACASYTNLIVTTGSKPYVISTQIRHDGNDTSSIAMIDSIVATTKDLFFNATLTLGYIQKENWGTLQTARPSRDLLKKVGDAYLDMWTDAKAADTIPWGTDCERVEGSRLTKPCGGELIYRIPSQIFSYFKMVADSRIPV